MNRKGYQRIVSLFLAIMLVMGSFQGVLAAEPQGDSDGITSNLNLNLEGGWADAGVTTGSVLSSEDRAGAIRVTNEAGLRAAVFSGEKRVVIELASSITLANALVLNDDIDLVIYSASGVQTITQNAPSSQNTLTRHFEIRANVTLKLQNIVLEGKEYGTGGIHVYQDSTFTLEGYGNNNITGAGGYGYGGGIRMQNAKEVSISGVKISDNTATVQGGGLLIENVPSVTLDHVEIRGNESLNGAGIYMAGETTNVIIKNSIIEENKITGSGSGGGVHVYSSKLDISGSVLKDNAVVGSGAALFGRVKARVSINETLVKSNTAHSGAAIYFTGEETDDVRLTIEDSQFSDNAASMSGGGIYLLNCNTDIAGSIFERNTAFLSGGGLFVWKSKLTASGSLIQSNRAEHPNYPSMTTYGGGIHLDQDAFVTLLNGTEIMGNYAATGGGIGVSDRSHWGRITASANANIVFSGNTARDYATIIAQKDINLHAESFEAGAIKTLSCYIPENDKQFEYAYNNYDIAYPELNKDIFRVAYVTEGSTTEVVDPERYVVGTKVFLLNEEEDKNKPVREGYEFLGWSGSASATAPDTFAEEDGKKVVTSAITENIILYAVWQERYEVRFDLNGGKKGESDAFDPIILASGANAVTIPAEAPYQLGYDFVGWYDEPQSYIERSDIDYRVYDEDEETLGNQYANTNTIAKSITLYAHWAETSFEIQDAYNVDYMSAENQLKIALSSLRDDIVINLHNDVELTDAMRATQLPDEALTVSISGVDGSGQATERAVIQTAKEQHFYVIDSSRPTTLNLKNIKMTNGQAADGKWGYGGITVNNGAELTLDGESTTFSIKKASDDLGDTAGAAAINGGTIKVIGSKATITGIAFDGNTVDNYGGAVYIDNGDVTIDDCTFTNNKAKNGGAIAVRETNGASQVTITSTSNGNTFFSNNRAERDGYGRGGAIYLASQAMYERLQLNDVSFSDNVAETGYVTKIAPRYADIHSNMVINSNNSNNFSAGSYAYNNYDVSYLDDFYSVTYHDNGADRGKAPIDDERYAQGEQASLIDNDTLDRDHYTFNGWRDVRGATAADLFIVEEDVHLYARWELNSYLVTFKDNVGGFTDGHTVLAFSCISDNLIPTEEDVKKGNSDLDDKFLEYWYLEGEPNKPYSFLEPITEDLTLHAKWADKDEFQVVFYSRGGTQVPSLTMVAGAPFDPEDVEYVSQRTHYEFKGWSPYPDSDEILQDAMAIEHFGQYMTNEVLKLYAVWEAIEYEVKWHEDGKVIYEQRATIETALNHDEAEIYRNTPEGKTFDGWYLELDEGEIEDELQILTPFYVTQNTDLHTHYSDIWYTVTIRDTDEYGDILEVFQVKHGDDVEEDAIVLSKENYDYVGLIAESGRKLKNVTEDLVVYAIFEIHSYTIKFYVDTDETLSPAWKTEIDHGDSFTGFPQELTALQESLIANPKKQHTFNYWGLPSGLNVETVFNGYPIVKDWDIYAHWKYTPEVAVDVKVIDTIVQQTAGEVKLDAGNKITLIANEAISNAYTDEPTYQWFMAFTDSEESVAVTTMSAANATYEMPYFAIPGIYHYYVVMQHGGVTVKSEPVKITILVPTLYTVSYDTNEAEGVLPTIPTLYTLYSPIFLPDESMLSRTGYTFKAWIDKKGDIVGDSMLDGIVVLDENLAKTADDWNNIEIIAQWERINEGGGGSGGGKPRTAELTIKGVNESGAQIYLATEQHTVGTKVTVQAPVIPAYTLNDEEEKTITISAVSSNNLLVFEYQMTDPNAYLPLETDTHIAYINGYPDGSVGPERNVTRAEVAMMFYRLVAADRKLGNYENAFTDVSASDWHYEAVSFLSNFNVVQGYANGTFEPERSITRAEFVTIASRFADMVQGEHSFTDISGSWAENYIVNTFTRGWITGYPDETFRPEVAITRAEAVTVINRMLGRNLQTADVPQDANVYNDLNRSHWAYAQILEASIAHEYEYRENGTEIWK